MKLEKYEREKKKTPFVTLNDGVCTVYKRLRWCCAIR